jgi:hypothetical protein
VSTNERAVDQYVAAATTDDDALDALAASLADDVALHGPLGDGVGPEAVLNGVRAVRPLFAPGTWTEPVADGDVLRVSATFPPGSVLGSAIITFRFDGGGRIVEVQQQLAPGAPPPPTPVTLEGAIAEAIDGALDNGTPVIVAYVDGEGQPSLSFRGTTQVYGDDRLAMWIRDPEGGLLRALPHNPRLTFFYVDRAAGVHYELRGRGRVESGARERDVVFERSPERERALDPERRGAAVVVDVHRVTGRGPGGRVNMERGSEE